MAVDLKAMTEDELKEESLRIRNEISEREEASFHAENTKHVGKCFVCKNNYSCPEKKSDYWNLYSMVLSLSDGNGVNVLQFQTDKYGDVSVMKRHSYVHLLGKRISREVFDKAAGKLVMSVAESLMVSVQPG